jgi:hypothetical protein
MFEPELYSTLLVIVCTTNVWAVIVPVAVNDPVMVCDPVNAFEPVVANDPVLAITAFTLPSFDDVYEVNDDVVANDPVTDCKLFTLDVDANDPVTDSIVFNRVVALDVNVLIDELYAPNDDVEVYDPVLDCSSFTLDVVANDPVLTTNASTDDVVAKLATLVIPDTSVLLNWTEPVITALCINIYCILLRCSISFNVSFCADNSWIALTRTGKI